MFDRADDARATRVVHLDPSANRTYYYWHVFVPGIRPGQLYGYQVEGPLDPASGMRFDPDKVPLGPYGRGVMVPRTYGRDAAGRPGDNTGTAMKSVVVDWERAPSVGGRTYPTAPRSVVVLFARLDPEHGQNEASPDKAVTPSPRQLP